MSYLFGSGWWIVWNTLLWLSFLPYVAMAVLLARASPVEPSIPLETTFGASAVGLIVLMLGTGIAGILWTVGSGAQGMWPWARNVGGAIVAALILGLFGVFGSGYYAVTPKQPMMHRWMAQLLCVACAALMLAFCLHAAWRFRTR